MIYLFAHLIGAVGLAGIWVGGSWVFAGSLVVFLGHPLVDFIFNSFRVKAISGFEKKVAFYLFYLAVPYSTTLLALSLWRSFVLLGALSSPMQISSGISPGLELFGIILTTGILLGVLAINPAHELIHRQSAWERFLGVYLLMLVNFGQFRINHVDVHHRHVATPFDPTTARTGELLYSYWIRSFFMGLVRSWQFELLRLRAESLSLVSNRMLHYLLGTVLGSALLFSAAEFSGAGSQVAIQLVAVWLLISLVAILMLQTVDFVEHYGLLRKELRPGIFEAVKPSHSWDSYSIVTNSVLFNLGLHAHHHTRSQLHFVDLRESEGARQMPFGYSVMFLCALVPPLWNRVVKI